MLACSATTKVCRDAVSERYENVGPRDNIDWSRSSARVDALQFTLDSWNSQRELIICDNTEDVSDDSIMFFSGPCGIRRRTVRGVFQL